MVERQSELTVKMIRSDRGGEFLGGDFTAFLDKHGIVHDLTCPYTPQQNGMAECKMRTLVERASLPSGATPYTLMYKTKPDLTKARVWGCMVQYMVPQHQRGGKLALKASWGLHLGVSPASKGWEVLDLAVNRIVTTVEAILYETQSLDDWKAERTPGSVHKLSTLVVSAPSPGLLADEIDDPLDALASAPAPPHVPMSIPRSTLPLVYPCVVPITKPSTSSAPAIISSPLPATKSISRPTPDTLSKSADDNEGRHDALTSAPRIGIVDGQPATSSENGVPGVQKQAGEQVTGERLTGEQISNGSSSDVVEVISEDSNDAGESPGDSSSSDVVEVKLPSPHSTHSNFGVPPKKWADVCPVFANTILDDANADTTLPELDPDMHADPERCVLIGGGWSKSQVDEALYFKFGADGVGCWLLVYVDDLLVASSSLEMLKDLCEFLQNAFELREIPPVQKYLGLEIVRARSARKLWLHQSAYVDKLRRRFVDKEQTGRCPKTPISIDAYTELSFDDEEYQAREEEEYRQKVGSLQFAATTTRPDIAYACSKLGSGLTIRCDQHLRELDRCIDYMVNTHDFALEFGGGPDTLRLVGYADSDDAGDRQTRSSTSGYVFVLGGAAVSCLSHRIKCMTLSSMESEYIAATEAGKEARRLRFRLAEFRLLDAGVPTVIHVDNSFAIADAEGLGLKGSLKHMERRYIWLQQMVKRKKLSLTFIPKSEQHADYLIKALHSPAFKRCSVAVGQVDLADDEYACAETRERVSESSPCCTLLFPFALYGVLTPQLPMHEQGRGVLR
ncbi:unnamed protein product [Closterium sp. NIES-53]